MPVKVVKRGSAWRLKEPDGTLLPKKYETKKKAGRAARARNRGWARSRGR
jgi:hypothetical protein